MNKTLRLLLHIHKKKKQKTTYLNWKTFNAKQTWIHAPKMLNILKKINNVLHKACASKLQMQQGYLVSAIQNVGNKLNASKQEQINYEIKQLTFMSIFNNEKVEVQSKNKISNLLKNDNTINIAQHYIMFLLLLNMYNNVKKTKNSILTLPRKRTAYTILKSPHADKKAREQFMKELYSVRISIKNYVAIMQYMNSIILSYSKAFIHSYKYAAFYENKI